MRSLVSRAVAGVHTSGFSQRSLPSSIMLAQEPLALYADWTGGYPPAHTHRLSVTMHLCSTDRFCFPAGIASRPPFAWLSILR